MVEGMQKVIDRAGSILRNRIVFKGAGKRLLAEGTTISLFYYLL